MTLKTNEQEIKDKIKEIIEDAYSNGAFWKKEDDGQTVNVDVYDEEKAEIDLTTNIDQLYSLLQSQLTSTIEEVEKEVIGEDEEQKHTSPIDACPDCIAVRHGNYIKSEQRAKLDHLKSAGGKH